MLNQIREKLASQGLTIESSEFIRKATTQVPLEAEQTQKVIDFLSSLEELDDVQKVYSNIAV